ncbi:hypothetical protein [Symbioplanes lichenis]|uniref:hypothetical protein n=1 Tax=Symbioplanes lichenis TaxID=1629072 RepID=UPI002739F1EE|nr:hypothetical protein [Actinoplanes lichenis]
MSYRIEDVLEAVQHGAPAPRTSTDDIIAGAHRIRRRRRTAAVAGAGGAAAVVVALVTGLTGTLRSAPPAPPVPAASPSPVVARPVFTQPDGFASTLASFRAGKYRVGPVNQVTSGYQVLPVYRDGYVIGVDDKEYPLADATITVYRPGVFDPATFGAKGEFNTAYGPAAKVDVGGTTALVRELTYLLPEQQAMKKWLSTRKDGDTSSARDLPQVKYTRTAVAWEYADDAWATFLPGQGRDPFTRKDTLAIVAGVRPAAERPLRMPYTFGWLPGGWQAVSVTQNAEDMSDVVSEVVLHDGPPSRAEQAGPVDDGVLSGGVVRVWTGTPKDGYKAGKGRRVVCDEPIRNCVLVLDAGHFAEFQSSGKGLTVADITKILMSLRPATMRDQESWPPAE